MSRTGRLTIHSCIPCGKQQIHVDLKRVAGAWAASKNRLYDLIEGVDEREYYANPIWITTRKCRECGNIIKGYSIRMNRASGWKKGRPA